MASQAHPLLSYAYFFLFTLANKNLHGQTKNTVDSHERLNQFLNAVVPDEIPEGAGSQSKEQFMDDVYLGIKKSMMSLRITHVNSLSRRPKNYINIVV